MKNVTCYTDINELKTFEAENTVHGMKSFIIKESLVCHRLQFYVSAVQSCSFL